jgi:hypothetical protein
MPVEHPTLEAALGMIWLFVVKIRNFARGVSPFY